VKRAVENAENAAEIDSFESISTLYGAAEFYGDRKMYAEAETLLKRAMELAESQRRPDESNSSTSLFKELRDSLVSLYRAEGKEGEAAALLSDIAAANLGKGGTNPDLPDAVRDREMGEQYIVQGKYPEAEKCLNRAIALLEKAPEPGSSVLLQWVLDRLADVYHAEGRDPEALQFFERAFRQWEKNAQLDRSRTGGSARSTMAIFALANFYRAQHRWSEMESIFRRGLEIQEAALGPDDLVISTILFELAGVYREEKKYEDAMPLYPRILQIQKSNLGQEDLHLAITLDEYARLLQDLGQESEAADMRTRAGQIRNNKARDQANN
jgi:tetratricopeptide (TPR) repeat protein